MRLSLAIMFFIGPFCAEAGTLIGHVRDENWFARYQTNPFGVGYYEYGVNASPVGAATSAGAASTDVFGAFQMSSLPAGVYNVASWDVWWRSAFRFNVTVPSTGNSTDADVRLHAAMWGYPAFWNNTGYIEFGQTFVATGPVTMIYLRNPLPSSPSYTLTVHDGSPTGAQVGQARTVSGYWDNRVIYGYGQMPTVKGRTYYVRLRTSGGNGILCQMDPRPDFSDPMPGGWLYLGNGSTLTSYPDRDLGLVIMCDDDGLLTNLFTRSNGQHVDGTSVGQTFIARGVNLISAAFWLNDPTFPTYVVRLYRGGPAGGAIGPAKRARLPRPGADPEMLVVWSPGECPLEPGQTYYIEVTKEGGGTFNVAQVNTSDSYPYGQAFRNGIALAGTDLAGTLMEEESAGSATRARIQFASEPTATSRSATNITIEWSTDVSSDTELAYAVDFPPYTATNYSAALVTNHSVTLDRLQPNTLYHFQVRSEATDFYPAISRDFVACTRNRAPNLLINGDFEEGTGPSPRSLIPGWTKANMDIRTTTGNWFFSLQPTNGSWFCEGALQGGNADGYIYQRVSGMSNGLDYTFSASILTAMRENDTWKYDVWDRDSRISYVRLGIDPMGGTNVDAASVQWTPRFYSHLHYTQVAKTVIAQTDALTVFVRMTGEGGQWHLYGIDDCALTHEEVPLEFGPVNVAPNNRFQMTLYGKARQTNTIEASTNLTAWRSIGGVANPAGAVQFTVPSLTNFPARFFRAR
jgi:hypothetical protein